MSGSRQVGLLSKFSVWPVLSMLAHILDDAMMERAKWAWIRQGYGVDEANRIIKVLGSHGGTRETKLAMEVWKSEGGRSC